MQQNEQLINIYHMGFVICLCLAIVFAIVSVILFFRLRIRDVFDFLTGRAQKRSVKQMEEENAKTGKLRQDYYSDLTSSDLYKGTSGRVAQTKYSSITEQLRYETDPTEKIIRLSESDCESNETILLNDENTETTILNDGSNETVCLSEGNSETVLLTPDMEATLYKETEEKPSFGTFIIIKEQIEIHTQEYI